MRVDGKPTRTLWPLGNRALGIIDQTRLPHHFVTVELTDLEGVAHAIAAMLVRGAPLIGATAAYGVAIAMNRDPSDAHLAHAIEVLAATRPTAINLRWALDLVRRRLAPLAPGERAAAAWAHAAEIADEDVAVNRAIGEHGLKLIEKLRRPSGPVQILTHCNAGWLATVDIGTATAPIYAAHDAGIPVHVWVDETRPRNQGASLTAWELGRHGVPHTVVADNTGGHLMQHSKVDLCIVGTDRTTAQGDVANKIGTYLKALAAHDNGVPFYVALPSSTIDWTLTDGVRDIPIEERSGEEVAVVHGLLPNGEAGAVRIVPEGSPTANYAFDVTPARLISGLITERGVAEASAEGLRRLFPERQSAA